MVEEGKIDIVAVGELAADQLILTIPHLQKKKQKYIPLRVFLSTRRLRDRPNSL